MPDPRRQPSAAEGTASFFRRRIPIDRPDAGAPPAETAEAVETPTATAAPEAEILPVEPGMEELIIGQDSSEEAGREIHELTDSLVRLQAEFDNYRKRQAREFRRLSSQGRKELITELLVVLDNFDRAENHRSIDEESPQELAEGLFRTVDQMRRILSQCGLSDLDVRVNDPFDPNIHEAVLAVEVEGLVRDTVLEILQKGYLFDQELLRPAMVRVGKPAYIELEPSDPEIVIPELLIPDLPIPEKPAPEPLSPGDDLDIEYEGEWGPSTK
jgi:molecular chaperone GrpE